MSTDAKTGQPIYAGAPSVGLRNVGSYQVSGEPWITGSDTHPASETHRLRFPYVTREVAVTNMGAETVGNYFRIHFVSGSPPDVDSSEPNPDPFGDSHKIPFTASADVFLGKHYVTLSGSQSITFKAKVKEIYISTNAHVGEVEAAELNAGAAADVVHYRIIADLTNVPTRRMYNLTGSGHCEAGTNNV